MTSACDVALYFLHNLDDVSPLKLQKLIYYAQAWSLAINDRALFEEPIEAWTNGPAVSSVYREYKKFREKSIPAPDQGCPSLNQEDLKTLKRVESIYGGLSADHLWKLSHSESPWSYARGELGFDEPSRNEISKDIMGLYYKGFLESRDGTLFIRAEVTNINKESRSTFFLKGDRIVNVSNKDAFSFMLQNWDELEDE